MDERKSASDELDAATRAKWFVGGPISPLGNSGQPNPLFGLVVQAEAGDVPLWLKLAAEVEELFGARMSTDPDFAATVRRNIKRGTAFVVRDGGGAAGSPLSGAAMWSPQTRRIGWLAVASGSRGRGVGTSLVNAIASAAGPGPLAVLTFGSGSLERDVARRFYMKLGFRAPPADKAASGLTRELLVRD